jgi:hypothetical protein
MRERWPKGPPFSFAPAAGWHHWNEFPEPEAPWSVIRKSGVRFSVRSGDQQERAFMASDQRKNLERAFMASNQRKNLERAFMASDQLKNLERAFMASNKSKNLEQANVPAASPPEPI